jgi:hypothetical protein
MIGEEVIVAQIKAITLKRGLSWDGCQNYRVFHDKFCFIPSSDLLINTVNIILQSRLHKIRNNVPDHC